MPYRAWLRWSAFAAIAAFVVVQATYLLIVGIQLIRPAVWDLSIAALILTGVATISLSAQDRIIRRIITRIDLMERRAIMHAVAEDEDPRELRDVRVARIVR